MKCVSMDMTHSVTGNQFLLSAGLFLAFAVFFRLKIRGTSEIAAIF